VITPAKVVSYTMNGDISVDIEPIHRTTGHKSAAFVGGFNTIGAPTRMTWSLPIDVGIVPPYRGSPHAVIDPSALRAAKAYSVE
jgi:hypothetical protein